MTQQWREHICFDYPKPKRMGNSHYKYGDKYCAKCERWFYKNDLFEVDNFCLCCGNKLRSRPKK